MPRKLSIRHSFRIYVGEERYLGPGRIELLEGILKNGSIAKAAEDMGMSYRKAWQMVKEMNAISRKPLVEKHLGGKSGGGAEVTAHGKAVMNQYFEIQQNADHFFDRALSKLKL